MIARGVASRDVTKVSASQTSETFVCSWMYNTFLAEIFTAEVVFGTVDYPGAQYIVAVHSGSTMFVSDVPQISVEEDIFVNVSTKKR